MKTLLIALSTLLLAKICGIESFDFFCSENMFSYLSQEEINAELWP